jgi:hypothetical protein
MRFRSTRWLLVATLVALAGLVPACDASGSTQGGAPLQADPCSAGSLSPTWTNIYNCYFGPTGKAGCSGKTSCHGPPPPCNPQATDCLSGTIIWACGPSRESCREGLMSAVPGLLCPGEQVVPDAGSETDAAAESGAVDAASEMTESGAPDAGRGIDASTPVGCDPTTTLLWHALRGASGPGQHDMPYTPASVVFTQQELDLISTWIREGAQDN